MKRITAIVLGLLTLLIVGMFAASAAYGEAGPFWHHRNNAKEGAGSKIEEKSPENFSGEGGEQTFNPEIAGTKLELTSKSVQAKGILYNNNLQGQMKGLGK